MGYNYAGDWLSEESKEICRRIVEKHKREQEEARKPKPRKKKK